MPHLSPAHHEISKHDSPYETKIKVKLAKPPGFRFKPRHVNESSQIELRYWPLGFSDGHVGLDVNGALVGMASSWCTVAKAGWVGSEKQISYVALIPCRRIGMREHHTCQMHSNIP
jgi:hypothetical protein